MTLFVIWPVSEDVRIRREYEIASGETVQASPAIDASGTRYMIGSSRAVPEMLTGIHGLVFGEDPADLGWVPADAG